MKKKQDFHYHVCPATKHRWMHKGARATCNLSDHAHCGQQLANDFPACVKGKKVKIDPPKFSFKADAFGYQFFYRNQPLIKAGFKAKEKKQKRHPATLKKLERDFKNQAQTLLSLFENGEGDRKVWAKVRKINRELATV